MARSRRYRQWYNDKTSPFRRRNYQEMSSDYTKDAWKNEIELGDFFTSKMASGLSPEVFRYRPYNGLKNLVE